MFFALLQMLNEINLIISFFLYNFKYIYVIARTQ